MSGGWANCTHCKLLCVLVGRLGRVAMVGPLLQFHGFGVLGSVDGGGF